MIWQNALSRIFIYRGIARARGARRKVQEELCDAARAAEGLRRWEGEKGYDALSRENNEQALREAERRTRVYALSVPDIREVTAPRYTQHTARQSHPLRSVETCGRRLFGKADQPGIIGLSRARYNLF